MTKIHEGSVDFEAKIPSTLKIKGDEIVKDVLTKGAAGAKDYSFIDDAGKTVTAAGAQAQIDAVNRLLYKDKPEGYTPTPEEQADADKRIAIIQNRLAGGQDTPKSNTLDYVAHKLIEIYALPNGEMTSYGFKVTPQMKSNIISGLVKQYSFFDRLGTFKAFFLGGAKSSRYADAKPKLPRKPDGKINWELFNDLYVAASADIANEASMKKMIEYYIGKGMSGSFSGLLNVAASRRYTDAFRRMGNRAYTAQNPVPSNDPAFKADATASVGDKSLSDPLGSGDDAGTIGDTLPDVSQFSSIEGMDEAFQEVLDWIRTNRNEHDAQAFEGVFMNGMKPKDVIADPRYPLVTDTKEVTKTFGALKKGKFPQVFKSIIEKHTDINTSDMDFSNFSSKIYSDRADAERKAAQKSGSDAVVNMSQADLEKYYATGELPAGFDDDDYQPAADTISMDDLSDEEMQSLFESVLLERVESRLKSLVAETVYNYFVSTVDALLND